jgi:hypothetical protein
MQDNSNSFGVGGIEPFRRINLAEIIDYWAPMDVMRGQQHSAHIVLGNTLFLGWTRRVAAMDTLHGTKPQIFLVKRESIV